jgi:acetyl esterase/lipase
MAALALGCLSASQTFASTTENTTSSAVIDENGTVRIPAYELPLSMYMSEEAKRSYIERSSLLQKGLPAEAAKQRETWSHFFLDPARAAYSVETQKQQMGGVQTEVFLPKAGVSPRNRDRVLINLHGGGFNTETPDINEWAESIPIAAVARIKVVSVDYRQAPEFKFPAASEDVARVYRALLKVYKPQNIGIYGCSAGGLLTAMSVAWFQKEQLPAPGAIGIFCAGATYPIGGDSAYSAPPFDGGPAPAAQPNPPVWGSTLDYLSNADPDSPLVSPGLHPDVAAKFPPTLIVTGTRDIAMSWAVHTQSLLVKAGVIVELHVWEGMPHAFMYSVDIPESKEMFSVTANFFDAHLGESR